MFLESLFSVKTFNSSSETEANHSAIFLNVSQHYTDDGLGNEADFELNMITQYLLQILGYHVKFTCYCILPECSRTITCFKVFLMYNNSI